MTTPAEVVANVVKLSPTFDHGLSEPTKREIYFWLRKLHVTPSELFTLDVRKLERRLEIAQQAEMDNIEHRLNHDRAERARYGRRHRTVPPQERRTASGNAMSNRTIWEILAGAAHEIETLYGQTTSCPGCRCNHRHQPVAHTVPRNAAGMSPNQQPPLEHTPNFRYSKFHNQAPIEEHIQARSLELQREALLHQNKHAQKIHQSQISPAVPSLRNRIYTKEEPATRKLAATSNRASTPFDFYNNLRNNNESFNTTVETNKMPNSNSKRKTMISQRRQSIDAELDEVNTSLEARVQALHLTNDYEDSSDQGMFQENAARSKNRYATYDPTRAQKNTTQNAPTQTTSSLRNTNLPPLHHDHSTCRHLSHGQSSHQHSAQLQTASTRHQQPPYPYSTYDRTHDHDMSLLNSHIFDENSDSPRLDTLRLDSARMDSIRMALSKQESPNNYGNANRVHTNSRWQTQTNQSASPRDDAHNQDSSYQRSSHQHYPSSMGPQKIYSQYHEHHDNRENPRELNKTYRKYSPSTLKQHNIKNMEPTITHNCTDYSIEYDDGSIKENAHSLIVKEYKNNGGKITTTDQRSVIARERGNNSDDSRNAYYVTAKNNCEHLGKGTAREHKERASERDEFYDCQPSTSKAARTIYLMRQREEQGRKKDEYAKKKSKQKARAISE